MPPPRRPACPRGPARSTPAEIPLTGGMSTPGVVRVADTVRRPVKPDSDYVHALLAHFERAGFDGAPRFLAIDERGRAVFSYIDGWTPPHNGFRLDEQAVRDGASLVRSVHDMTEGTAFARGSEVACHPSLSQPNFVFRGRRTVGIIDWDGTQPGRRLANFADFLWAFVHPSLYGEGEPAARMLRTAREAYGWSGDGLVDAMVAHVRAFRLMVGGDPGAAEWAARELEYMERNAELFRASLG